MTDSVINFGAVRENKPSTGEACVVAPLTKEDSDRPSYLEFADEAIAWLMVLRDSEGTKTNREYAVRMANDAMFKLTMEVFNG